MHKKFIYARLYQAQHLFILSQIDFKVVKHHPTMDIGQ